jgi:peroxiredoxin
MSKYLLLLATIAPLMLFSQMRQHQIKPGELTINGTLRNMPEEVPFVYMICMDWKNGDIDSAKVTGNKYQFRGHTGATTMVTLFMKDPRVPDYLKNKYIIIFVTEPAGVTISSTDSFSNAIIKGSRANIENNKLKAQVEPYYRQANELYKKQKGATKEEAEALIKQIDSLNEKRYNGYYYYIKMHSSSLLINYALYQYMGRLRDDSPDKEVAKLRAAYSKLPQNDKNSYYGKRIKKKLDKYEVAVGMMAPSFVQNDTLGQPVSLSSYKGKYVLLEFWASWCIPCRRESPTLVNLFNAYKDKGLTILSVSLDQVDDKAKWIRAIHQDRLTWTHVSDLRYWDNAVAVRYKVDGIPQNFLIDPSGKIIAKGLRGEELEKKMKEIFE